MKRRAYGVAASVLILTLALFTGVALAGNPHGTPPGQDQSSQPAAPAQPADNSTGVKPGPTTAKSTHEQAGSSKTKLYGNGKTAGQIATSRGASKDTVLYGPGNSQPHKVAVCKNGKTHYVDVHAVKSYSSTGACPSSSSAPTKQSTAAAQASTPSATPSTSSGAVAGATQTAASTPRSGVLGARATVKSHPRAGVLGATARSGVLGATARSGKLPFTGLPLWIPALAALGLLAAGFGLRRRAGSLRA
jgi:hypothetical protein